MKIKKVPVCEFNRYPVTGVRFLIPVIAIRGWWKNGGVQIVFAFWTWQCRFRIDRTENAPALADSGEERLVETKEKP